MKDTASLYLDSIQPLFAAGARLTANFGQQPVSWTVPKYIAAVKKNIQTQQVSSSREKELAAKVDVFGNIAHVFSTYELTLTIKGNTIVRRGINSIQLIRQNGAWLISSLIWDRENDTLKLPARYLSQQLIETIT